MELKPLFQEIANAIREKDGSVEPIAASDFPNRIRAIPAGGRDGWLELPEPEDDEMYLLMHIPEGGSELLAFNVGLAPGGVCSVELGTMHGGVFVSSGTIEAGDSAVYEAELFAADYGDVTGDGFVQAVVKISGRSIRSWDTSEHSRGGIRRNWRIVEIACRLPSGRGVGCGGSKAVFALDKLRRFAWFGEADDRVSYVSMFNNCLALETVLSLPPINSSALSYVFQNCVNLRETFPLSNITQAASYAYAFQSCGNLEVAPPIDLSLATNLAGLFSGCVSLRDAGKLNIGNAVNCTNMFNGCSGLEHVLLDPNMIGWAGADINLSPSSLDHAAIIALIESLPIIATSHMLTLTSNPGVSELTDDEKAIAANKNWTLIL